MHSVTVFGSRMMLACRMGVSTLRCARHSSSTQCFTGTSATEARPRQWWLYLVGLTTAGGIGLIYALEKSLNASFLSVPVPHLPWFHSHVLHGYDAAALRRGYQVYKQVCCACHSMKQLRYRHFIDVFMSPEEAKAEAAENQVQDGPNDQGEMFMRPGTVNDFLPSPYPNDVVARNANHGAAPPDLSLITLARHGGEDYIFMLLTGYTEAPAGMRLEPIQHYNPYFPAGAAIGMAPALFDDMIEYADGTPASVSQMAKDVATFLKFCSEPELSERKRMSIKLMLVFPFVAAVLVYMKRHQWSYTMSRKIVFPKYEKMDKKSYD